MLLPASLCSKASAGCQVMTWPTSVLNLCLRFYNLELSIELFQFPSLNHAKRRPGPAWQVDWPAGLELEGVLLFASLCSKASAGCQVMTWPTSAHAHQHQPTCALSRMQTSLFIQRHPLSVVTFDPIWKRMNCWKTAPWLSSRARVSSSVSLSNSGDIQFGCNGNFPKR